MDQIQEQETRKLKLPPGYALVTEKPELSPTQPWTGYVDSKHIKPNPDQPRDSFPQEDQEGLEGSHESIGQQRAVSVIPFTDPENPDIWFMIHDGERSWRSLSTFDTPVAWVVYNPLVTLEDIGFQSFAANFGSLKHNHAETIEAVWKEVKINGRKVSEVAKAVIRTEVWVYGYLALHKLHPDIIPKLDLPRDDPNRLRMNLAKIILKAPIEDQIGVLEQVKDLSPKRALAKALRIIEEDPSSGTLKKVRPSTRRRSIGRTLTRLEEDIGSLTEMDGTAFTDDRANTEEIGKSILGSAAQLIRLYEKITGKKVMDMPETPQQKGSYSDVSAATAVAERFFPKA